VQSRVPLAEPEKRRIMGQKWLNTKGQMLEGMKKKDLCIATLKAALLT